MTIVDIARALLQLAEAGNTAAYVLLLAMCGDKTAELDIMQLAKERQNENHAA